MKTHELIALLITVLAFTAGPLLLQTAAAFLAWGYRLATRRPIDSTPPNRKAFPQPWKGLHISVQRPAMVTNAPPGSEAADAREQARRMNAGVRWAHVAAWLLYAAVLAVLFVAFTNLRFTLAVKVALAYGVLAPSLLILLWAIRLPIHRRLLIFILYAAAGLALIALTEPSRTWTVAKNVAIVAFIPMPGLLVLSGRRYQRYLLLWIAAGAYFLGTGFLLDRFRYSATIGSSETVIDQPWLIPLGLGVFALGMAGAWFLVRQQRRSWRVIAIVAGVIGAVLLDLNLVHPILLIPVSFACFVALAVLQALALWYLYKGLAWVAERGFLTPELVQVHLCWGFLTLYFLASAMMPHSFYRDPAAVRWGVPALNVLLVTLHALLYLVYLQHRAPARKGLLLLRVFGRRNERETLLEDLNDTWRRVGTVELLVAGDVESQILESRRLSGFLLRRVDRGLLDSEQAIGKAIDQRQLAIEGDARYPVNPFFCQDLWFTAFEQLADRSDVVMMDLRGFTPSHEGCVRELEHLLRDRKECPLSRVVFLVDVFCDVPALDAMARTAGVAQKLTVLQIDKRSDQERRAMFELLLKAAYA